jgi:hypothetical protein
VEPETLFSDLYVPRVAFFLYFRKQMKATPHKGKQMKGSLIEQRRVQRERTRHRHRKNAFDQLIVIRCVRVIIEQHRRTDLRLQRYRVPRRREILGSPCRTCQAAGVRRRAWRLWATKQACVLAAAHRSCPLSRIMLRLPNAFVDRRSVTWPHRSPDRSLRPAGPS